MCDHNDNDDDDFVDDVLDFDDDDNNEDDDQDDVDLPYGIDDDDDNVNVHDDDACHNTYVYPLLHMGQNSHENLP